MARLRHERTQAEPGDRPNQSVIASWARPSERFAVLEDLVGIVEAEAGVVAQRGQGALEVRRAEDAAAELHELAIDPLDLGEAGRVNVLRLEIEGRVDLDEIPVRLDAAGHVQRSGPVVGTRDRRDVARQRVAVAPKRRARRPRGPPRGDSPGTPRDRAPDQSSCGVSAGVAVFQASGASSRR